MAADEFRQRAEAIAQQLSDAVHALVLDILAVAIDRTGGDVPQAGEVVDEPEQDPTQPVGDVIEPSFAPTGGPNDPPAPPAAEPESDGTTGPEENSTTSSPLPDLSQPSTEPPSPSSGEQPDSGEQPTDSPADPEPEPAPRDQHA